MQKVQCESEEKWLNGLTSRKAHGKVIMSHKKTFIGHLEKVMDKNKERGKGIPINGVKIDNLRFADDIDLLEESPQELQRALQLLSNEGRKTGYALTNDFVVGLLLLNGFHSLIIVNLLLMSS